VSDELRSELHTLAEWRRRVIVEIAIAVLTAGAVVAGLWRVELDLPDTRALAVIGLALLSWAVVRTVVTAAALLEEPCPACYAPFFGGIAWAPIALPVPPSKCHNCRISLEGQRTPHRSSDPSGRAGPAG